MVGLQSKQEPLTFKIICKEYEQGILSSLLPNFPWNLGPGSEAGEVGGGKKESGIGMRWGGGVEAKMGNCMGEG